MYVCIYIYINTSAIVLYSGSSNKPLSQTPGPQKVCSDITGQDGHGPVEL